MFIDLVNGCVESEDVTVIVVTPRFLTELESRLTRCLPAERTSWPSLLGG